MWPRPWLLLTESVKQSLDAGVLDRLSPGGESALPRGAEYWTGAAAMSSGREQVGPYLGDRAHARELHGAHQLVAQDLERAGRARLARRAGTVESRTAEHHGFRAQRDRLD